MMISKEEFLKYVEEMKRVHEFQEDLVTISHKYYCGDFWDYPDLWGSCCHLMNKVLGLEEFEHYGSDFDYFVDELEFGNKWTEDSVTEDGVSLDWSTPEKFYDWVVKNNEAEKT